MSSLQLNSGWLNDGDRRPSPNFDQRPPDCDITALIIHAISLPPERFGGCFIEDFFCNSLDPTIHPYFNEISQLCLSAHFLIKRDGACTQFVSTLDRAWHAGISELEGQNQVNDFSIGIELEGSDKQPFESAQYDSLGSLTKAIISAHPLITKERIVGHSDIAPKRKTDPGPHFDWQLFREQI